MRPNESVIGISQRDIDTNDERFFSRQLSKAPKIHGIHWLANLCFDHSQLEVNCCLVCYLA